MRGSDHILATRTTTRLLDALHEPGNEPVWVQLDTRYRPVIAGLARRLGLFQTDADEVAQQTLTEFVRAYREGRYDRAKGRLSSWILGIAHNTALRILRSGRRATLAGPEQLEQIAGPIESLWEQERDRAILDRALCILRDDSSTDERTILAFELVGLRQVPAAEVAKRCGMTVEQVYVAKSRVTGKLRALVEELTEAFEADV